MELFFKKTLLFFALAFVSVAANLNDFGYLTNGDNNNQ